MTENDHEVKMINEEVKQIKFFLWLFYIIFLGYDILLNYVQPYLLQKSNDIPKNALGIWYNILVVILLPIAIYLIKKGKPYSIKYLYVISYTLLDIVNMFLTYWGSQEPIRYGHIADVFLLLFAPIFINKKYFWVVSVGTIGKFILAGIILHDKNTIIPISIYIIISIIAMTILSRFLSYVRSLTIVHEEMRHKEKLAYIGQVATSIGHEIRNPLSSLKGFTQLQQEKDSSENNFYPIMIQEIDRINNIVEELMFLGKPKSPNFNQLDLKHIIDYVSLVTNQLANSLGINVVVKDYKDMPSIECDEKQMKQVFINIIKNAIEAMQDIGGIVEVSFKKEKDKIKVVIQDQGHGIEEENIKMLGEPFYTTKQNGTGLGLMVTKKIIEDHQGEIIFESQIGEGTKISVLLPIKQN